MVNLEIVISRTLPDFLSLHPLPNVRFHCLTFLSSSSIGGEGKRGGVYLILHMKLRCLCWEVHICQLDDPEWVPEALRCVFWRSQFITFSASCTQS